MFDIPGLNLWIDRFAMLVEGGAREAQAFEQVADALLTSREFGETSGDAVAFTDRGFVELIYRDVLDRDGERAGVDFWQDTSSTPGFPACGSAGCLCRFA